MTTLAHVGAPRGVADAERQKQEMVVGAFVSFLEEHRGAVGDAVDRHLAAAREGGVGAAEEHVIEALRSLAGRGGKRVRPTLVLLAYEAWGGEGGARRVMDAAASIELLQVYLLTHDDWMDGDDLRRGGPAVHAMLGRHFGSRALGDASAVLAGDLACALAQRALAATPVAPARVAAALARLAEAQVEVVLGQIADVCGPGAEPPLDPAAVERMHARKTGAYTVAAPLAMGALLAGADETAVAKLDALARPLGVAFQLRDDLLGTYGDPRATGKDRYGDLRRGKRTALLAAAHGDASLSALVARVVGDESASDEACASLAEALEASGARGRVERRVDELRDEALERLGALGLGAPHAARLSGAAHFLAGARP